MLGTGRWIHGVRDGLHITKERRMGSRDVCAKCGGTLEERVRWWLIPEKGVKKIGTGTLADLFLYCENCQKAICGGCSIDLAVSAGCPFCRQAVKELTHQEILTLLGPEKVSAFVREGKLRFAGREHRWWQFWK
jgi:hypothetical protein